MADELTQPESTGVSIGEAMSYNVFLSEEAFAWVAVLLEGQAAILAKLNGTTPEEEKALLLKRLPGKQAAIKHFRDSENNPSEKSLSAS